MGYISCCLTNNSRDTMGKYNGYIIWWWFLPNLVWWTFWGVLVSRKWYFYLQHLWYLSIRERDDPMVTALFATQVWRSWTWKPWSFLRPVHPASEQHFARTSPWTIAIGGNCYSWLVLWNMNEHFLFFPYIGNHNPNWLICFFQRGRYITKQIGFDAICQDVIPLPDIQMEYPLPSGKLT